MSGTDSREQSVSGMNLPPEGNLRQIITANPRLAVPKQLKDQKQVLKPRLTVLETVYYQEPGGEPTWFPAPFSIMLESAEQPCIRKLKIGQILQSLDTWLSSVSELVIRNDEGTYRDKPGRPSEEEREDMKKRIIEVYLTGHPSLYVRPGRSCRFEPVRFQGVQLRCQHGEARVTIAAFPT